MLRFEETVFGPIHSRRLGSSLGINLLPHQGKLCNFDCIYCECGWNADGRGGDRTMPGAADVEKALEVKLKKCLEDGVAIDSITFSGNGEPTLNPEFPEIIDVTVTLRDRYFPKSKISVLSNATMISRPEVISALKKVDNPILKIDAPTDEGVAIINRPSGHYRLSEVVDALKSFDGDFILQTMFLRGGGFDSSDPKGLAAWMEIVRQLAPREIMVYTIDRETPESGLSKLTVAQMETLVQPLVEEGFKVQIRG
ncbi:MAG: radical SAM protein [Candidatus Cryptobacteroides sp.]